MDKSRAPGSLGLGDFEIKEEQNLYQGFSDFRRLHIEHQRFDGGSQSIRRELLVRHEAVAVVIYDPINEVVVLVEQLRVGAVGSDKGPWLLELVAGLVDKDEEPEQVVLRESFEEAGCEINKLGYIQSFFLSPGGSNERLHLFWGLADTSGLGGCHGLAEEGEDILVHCLPLKEAFGLLDRGEISNAITLIGLQWLKMNQASIA